MINPRIKLTWGTPAEPNGRWRAALFLLSKRRTSGWQAKLNPTDRTLVVSLRGLLIWSLPFFVAAYFLGAVFLTRWYERTPHNRITYLDVISPTRWTHIGALRGKALIDDAGEDFKAGRVQTGFVKLRSGLARDPANAEARILLARWCTQFRLRPLAQRTLMEGCVHGYADTDHLRQAFALLAASDNPELVLEFGKQARAGLAALATPPPRSTVRLIDEQEMRALLALERPGEAARRIRETQPGDDTLRTEAELADLLQRKEFETAVLRATGWAQANPNSDKIQRLVARVYRDAGRIPEMQTHLERLRALNPTSPGAAGFAVLQNLIAGQDAAARAHLDDYFFRFGADAASLNVLATAMADTHRDDMLARLEATVRDHGFDPSQVLLARLKAQLANHDWDRAQNTCHTIEPLKKRLSKPGQIWFETATALIDACRDEGSGVQARLVSLVSRNPGSPKLYREVIDPLIAANRLDTARQIVGLAEGLYPDSRYLTTVRLTVAAGLERREAAIALNRPAAAAGPQFKDGAALLAELDRMAREGHPDEALRLLLHTRRNAPAWLANLGHALTERELDLCVRSRDFPLLQLTIRNFLRATPDRGGRALELALRWHAADQKEASLLAVREIIKLYPDNDRAVKTLVEWTPGPLAPPSKTGTEPAESIML